ncbi:S8 family serine peptidase [Candidatus Pacearchaeota archaeon]|nr:S8 family serine peptidase [Candidatus Pacearchaeota archaeon]
MESVRLFGMNDLGVRYLTARHTLNKLNSGAGLGIWDCCEIFPRLVIFLVCGLMLVVPSICAQEYIEGELLVKYKDDYISSGFSTLSALDTKLEIQSDKIISQKVHHIKFDKSEDVVELAKKYSDLSYVEYAEPNYILHTFETPDDVFYSNQWHLPKISSELAWNLTTGNESVIIAIIDTGVQWNHSDLENNIWNNTDEDCLNEIDDDSNGYVDDCRGYDFVDINNESKCSSLIEDCNVTDNDPSDGHGHGTHCAGISAASTNNSIGVAGICWNCKIMPLRAGYNDTSGLGSLSTSSIVDAINYAINNNATIISMSFGGSNNVSSINNALNSAYDAGIILIAAAGNTNNSIPVYPAAYSNVISVGATDSQDNRSSFSNYGSWVDIAAPGSNISSTYIGNSYTSMDGTSMSTPLVAGAIGLIKGLFPVRNQTEILNTLNETGTFLDFVTDNISRINVYDAILSLDNTAPNVTLVSPVHNHVNMSVNQSFVCNATDWQLANVTFKIWNSSEVLYNESSRNLTGVENETSFDLVNMSNGEYYWNCFVYDDEGNLGSSSSNFSLTVGGIEVVLNSPLNGSYTNVNETSFNCSSFSDAAYELTNVTFSLWNSSGSLINTSIKNISGFANTTIFNYSFFDDGVYDWACVAFNNNSDEGNGVNYSLTYDSSVPVISGLSVDASSSSATISWVTNESSNSSVWVSGGTWSNSSELVLNHSIVVSGLGASASYSCVVTSCDEAGNCGNDSKDFTTDEVIVSSGGGGGSTTQSYFVEGTEFRKGVNKLLGVKDEVSFNLASGRHGLKVEKVGTDFVDIVVESEPIYLTLKIGEEIKLNLSSSSYYDLVVRLNGIASRKANISVRRIFEERVFEVSAVEEEEVVDVVEEEVVDVEEEEELDYWDLFWGILIVVLVFLFLRDIKKKEIKRMKFFKKKKRKNGKSKKVKT